MFRNHTRKIRVDDKFVLWVVMAMFTTFLVPPAHAEVLRSTYKLPIFSESFQSLSSVAVDDYSPESSAPFVGAENVHLHNFTIRATGSLAPAWRDKALKLEISNTGITPAASLCTRSAQGVQLCNSAKLEPADKHKMFSTAKVYRVGSFEIALLAPNQLCRQADSCVLVFPSFALSAISRGQSAVVPKFLSLAVFEKSLQLIDGERGQILMGVGQFPDGLTGKNLGVPVSVQADHRGEIQIKFQNVHLSINLLNESATLLSSNGRVWNASVGSHTTRWTEKYTIQSSQDINMCSGNPLHSNGEHGVYPQCIVNLRTNNEAKVLLLPARIDGAIQESGVPHGYKTWTIVGSTLRIQKLRVTPEGIRTSPVFELPFHGRAASEIQLASDRVLRRTAYGFYAVNNEGEIKTSLPYSAKPSYFSGNARHVLLGSEDANKHCVLRHLTASPSAPQFWKESGHVFPCDKTQVNAKENGLTITRIDGRVVEIIDLNLTQSYLRRLRPEEINW